MLAKGGAGVKRIQLDAGAHRSRRGVMVDKPTSAPPARRDGQPLAGAARESRLAAALRTNLRRRKAASKTASQVPNGEED